MGASKAEKAEKPAGNAAKGETATKEKPAKEKVIRKVTYEFVKHPGTEEGAEKLPPQAKVLLNHLERLGTASRAEYLKALEASNKAGDKSEEGFDLNTRQPVDRILAFYQARLVEGGYMKTTKEEAPAEAKDAKETKKAA